MSTHPEQVERELHVGLRCECGWGMWQTEHRTVLCKNPNCAYFGIEYKLPAITLERADKT